MAERDEISEAERMEVDQFLGFGVDLPARFVPGAGMDENHFLGARGPGEARFLREAVRTFTSPPPGPGLKRERTFLPAASATQKPPPPIDPCFIATALAKAHGLDDDCRMLRVLREFRDTYMQETSDRRELVEQYYREAPGITEALKDSLVWDYASSVIWYVVHDIETGYPDMAMERYKGLFHFMRYEAAKAREK